MNKIPLLVVCCLDPVPVSHKTSPLSREGGAFIHLPQKGGFVYGQSAERAGRRLSPRSRESPLKRAQNPPVRQRQSRAQRKRPLCRLPFFYPETNGNLSLPRQIEMPNGSGEQILQTDHVPTGRAPSSGAHVGPRAGVKGIDRPLAL
ncbi:hypothetical protein HMPREF0262_03242 [Clostridium sp. ATCC 29733]|nr:hypothetical protein HMPREF0262_03242 [Clostridium sp. ATCC 29733]